VPLRPRPSRRRPGSHRLLIAALGLLVVLAILDEAVRSLLVVPLFVLAPLLVALRAGRRETGIAALAAFALAVVSGLWTSAPAAGWIVAVVLVGGGGAAAWIAAGARERVERDARRLEALVALGEAGTGASAQDTAARVCALLVPAVAEHCVIALHGDDGAERVLAAAPDACDAADRSPAAPGGASVSAPLRVRGRAVGTLWMGASAAGRRGRAGDERFAEVLADRVALALENAGLSEELLDAERRFQAIVDGMVDGVTVRAADGHLVYSNDAALAVLRMGSHEQLRGMRSGETMALFDVFDEDGRPVTLDQLPGARAWALDEDPEPMLVRNVVRATGEQRWLLSKAIAIRYPDGRPQYVVNFTEDVSAVKRAELAQRMLAEAGRVLMSSLDEQQALQQVAMLAVPEMADWCGVDMAGRGRFVEPVAIAHVDGEKRELARRLRERHPVATDAPVGLAAVLRGDVAHWIADETPDEALVAYATDDEHLALMREVGFNSVMVVPVAGRSGILGTLTFVSRHAHRFDAADLELAEELGRRAGVAVENARLYTERADIAHTLQVALVPDPVPLAPGWDVAAMYRPAGEATEAGGDFYDMVRTDDGWLIVMGDVAGKGAQAASLTGLARYTLRTAAMLTGDPEAALAALNAGLMRRDDVAYCTAALVSLVETPEGARARILSAGHPLPVVMQDGRARALGRPGPLLGAIEDASWPAEEVALRPGDRLVLYTDGVTDARGPTDRFGDERLLALLSSVDGAPPSEVVQHVERALREYEDGPARDDTAVLAVGRLHPDELALPGGPEAVGLARAALRARLEGDMTPERLGDVLLIASELVTNAIRHGGAERPDRRIRVRARRLGARLHLEVRDDGPGFGAAPAPVPGDADGAPGGMGLELVARLANAWGTERQGRTTLVWADLDPDRPGAPVH
jgi:GAF domain-containing protein/anti-sigma regulatory factor (Ser/Thr protein kinase)